MFVIVGTLPLKALDLKAGNIILKDGKLTLKDFSIAPSLGTSAMAASACITCRTLKRKMPYFITVGDIGDGKGSKRLYENIAENNIIHNTKVLAMHYIMPQIAGLKQFIDSIKGQSAHMTLIADAGSMYAAKAANVVSEFDIFTPDAAEMAYLADPDATHPAYVKHLLFKLDASEILTLIKQAYKNGTIPDILLVKGPIDYIVEKGKVLEKVAAPCIPEMEAIGGTGDSLTGILSALISTGYSKVEACITAARINRLAGALAKPEPSTPVSEIIKKFPAAIKEIGICV
jgi:NAD(P)H-hydrate repair Nnr-like enzyme with NAD(P)H-hydrate dehydratase domain